jgi:methionyl-tRNA synthetase
MTRKFYITTPIYYVNDVPHIGHAYTTIAADVLARYHRLRGDAVFFLTGTDEHGQKVEKAAQERGLTPKAHADSMTVNFQQLWEKLEITNDAFIRTTDKEHVAVVQELLQKLFDKGEIEQRTYEGWYCTPDERFWTEKEIVEGKCPDCGRPVERISESNYFFLMSKYQERLIAHIEQNPDYIRPESRRNEVLGFLRSQTLGDLCISRPKARLSWGIELPFDHDFVTYVWFDALVNYFSATRYLSPPVQGSAGPSAKEKFWWPADHHLVGKDILTTHSVYWSTMLMGLGLPLPGNIFAHGWWTQDGKKMSKSLGNVIDPHEVIDAYGADALRYFVLREVPFGLDGDFSRETFVTRFNTELANDLGNLLSRVLTMIEKYFEGKVPKASFNQPLDQDLREIASGIPAKIDADLASLAFTRYLQDAWSLVTRANRYVEENSPWILAKNGDMVRLGSVLYNLAESLRLIGLHLFPVMPATSQNIWDAIGLHKQISACRLDEEQGWGGLKTGTAIQPGAQLFPRIVLANVSESALISESVVAIKKKSPEKKMEKIEDTKKQSPTAPALAAPSIPDLIGIEDFMKVDLRVGKIVLAERVEKSEKLVRLKVDIGTETRQVVAGIGKSYTPEELIGKSTVIVANLKPAKLMGIESQGMLLAASSGDLLAVATFDRETKQGSRVK